MEYDAVRQAWLESKELIHNIQDMQQQPVPMQTTVVKTEPCRKYDVNAEPPNDDPQLHWQLKTVNDTRDQGPGNTFLFACLVYHCGICSAV